MLRQAEKLRERFSQRYTRHSRALQDKRQRDKLALGKSVKECYSAVKIHEDKTIAQLQKDIKAWSTSLGQKIDLGKSVFLGTYVEVRVLVLHCTYISKCSLGEDGSEVTGERCESSFKVICDECSLQPCGGS